MARKYVKRGIIAESIRKSKCGHWSKAGRYLKCEICQPELPQDCGDWTYFGEECDNEEVLEEV